MSRLSDCIDLGWVSIFGPSLYVHYYSYCVIGMCQDLRTGYVATFDSILFVLTVCSLLAKWELWPKSLKCPPNSLLYIYMALASILVTNIAFRLIWLPLLDVQAVVNKELSSWLATISLCLGCGKKSKLYRRAEWLTTPPGLAFASQIWSILLFLWMLDATNKFESIWRFLERVYTPIVAAICNDVEPKKRVSPRRGCRQQPNFCEYADDDFLSPTIIDPSEAHGLPHMEPEIPWDEETD